MREPETPEEAEELEPVDPAARPRDRGSMGLLDHLDELRKMLIRCALAFVAGFAFIAVFLAEVRSFLEWPLVWGLGEAAARDALVTTTPMGVFTVIIQICFLGATCLALPAILYFVGQFVAPALMEKETRLLRPFTLAAFALFLAGVVFAYYLLTPAAIEVAGHLNALMGFKIVWSADKYYSLLVWLVITMGLSFQFPLILLACVKLGFLNRAKLRSARRYAIVGFFVFSAAITPTPDPLTLLICTAPLLLLYELSILLAGRFEPRDEEAPAG